MNSIFSSWLFWAMLSALFAALTAIFAKIGVSGINPDYATFVRTIVILIAIALILTLTGQWQGVEVLNGRAGLFLVLSGIATGASWLAYFRALKLGQASQVAPIDKLSVVLVALFAVIFLGEKLSMPHWIGIGLIGAGAVILAAT